MNTLHLAFPTRRILTYLFILAFVSSGFFAPQYIGLNGLKYKEAHAFLLKLAVGLAAKETKFLVKGWLKSVAKREGKRVALAGAKALTKLPGDKAFQTAIVVALSGKGFAEAGDMVARTAKSGAKSQWSEDKKRLAQNPNMIAADLENHVASEMQSQWNAHDDQFTCGRNNIAIQRDQTGHFYIANSENEALLEGRALLQRALLLRMITLSDFTNSTDAELAAQRYAGAACKIGKSRKAIAFLGGLALNKGEIFNSTSKAINTMKNVYVWAQKHL